MASTLIATADVESIVQSQLNVSLLDIFVDDADAEITSQFGRHPTDAADPCNLSLRLPHGAAFSLTL